MLTFVQDIRTEDAGDGGSASDSGRNIALPAGLDCLHFGRGVRVAIVVFAAVRFHQFEGLWGCLDGQDGGCYNTDGSYARQDGRRCFLQSISDTLTQFGFHVRSLFKVKIQEPSFWLQKVREAVSDSNR